MESFLRPINIGSVTLPNNLVLAPMSGVTNSHFRRLIKRENPGALGLVVTEFISIEGLTRGNAQSQRMMSFCPSERPISIQIFGNPIARMVDAAIMVEESGAEILDINCGCPVPKVVKKGGGCELMRQPEHLAEILRAVRRAISIPLTLKIRSGWDDSCRNAVEIARMAEDSGVAMIAVHGRTRSALYRGDADWDIVRQVADAVTIPVIGSGDVLCAESARRAFAHGVDGIMIGRGALLNPWIFTEIAAGLRGEEIARQPDSRTVDILESYLALLREDLPERGVVGRMKQLASQVTRRVKGSTEIRRALCGASTTEQMTALLEQWREQLLHREESGDYAPAGQSRFDSEPEKPSEALQAAAA